MTPRLGAEALGTALLLFVIVGSGIAADRLTDDAAFTLFAHAVSVGLGLAVLIAVLLPVSGSHFNPAVTLALWRTGEIQSRAAIAYVIAQVGGAVAGVMVANLAFGEALAAVSSTERTGAALLVSEFVGTLVLVLLILALVRSERLGAIPAAVGAWVAVIIFSTPSTGFANPAVTIARMFTDTYTGIDPGSVVPFVVVQLLAALTAVAIAVALFPVSERSHQTT